MFFGKFPGWWANTVAIYCPSRPSQLITKNIIIYGEWGDAQCCTSLTCPTWWKASMSVILTTAAFNLSLSRHLLALSRMNSLWYPLQGGDILVPGKLVEAIIDQLSSHDPKTICDLLSVEGRRKLNCLNWPLIHILCRVHESFMNREISVRFSMIGISRR